VREVGKELASLQGQLQKVNRQHKSNVKSERWLQKVNRQHKSNVKSERWE